MNTTETTVRITPDTDLREHIRPGDLVRVEFEVGTVIAGCVFDDSDTPVLARGGAVLRYHNPITIKIIRPAEPTIAEQIEALEEGTRFIIHWPDGSQGIRFRVAGGYAARPDDTAISPKEWLASLRIEVLP